MRVLVIAAFASALVGCARTSPTGPLAAEPPDVRTIVVGGSPTEVAVAGDAVWVADARRGRLVAVDPATARPTARPVRIDAPLDLAVGEGALWVTSGTGAVRRIDPSTRRAALVARVRDPGGVAAGLGSVWVTSRRDGTVTALDPRTGAMRGRPVRTGTVPGDVVVGFGAVWVANTQDGTVSRLDPRSRQPIGGPIQVAEAQILALAAGQDGVWVAATDSAQNASVELRRIEPGNGALDERAVGLPTGVPVDLAAGLGSVWSTDVGNRLPGTPGRDPALLRVAADARVPAGRPIPVGDEPTGVATGAGAVWVTSAGDGALRRIVPGAVDAVPRDAG